MKAEIHPEYKAASIYCACGNVIQTRSTKDKIQVDICSSCHPFFTGKQKLVDTAGRIDRFKKKYGENPGPVKVKKKKEEKKAKREAKKEEKKAPPATPKA